MIQAFSIVTNGIWSLLSIEIPISDTIKFTIWQYMLFCIILGILIKQLFRKSTEGGGD